MSNFRRVASSGSRWWIGACVALVCAVPSCGRGEAPPDARSADGAPASSPSDVVCGVAQQRAFEADLLTRCAFADQPMSIPVPPAPWTTPVSQPPASALLVEVTSGRVVIERGEPVELDRLVAALREAWSGQGSATTTSWALAIAADVPREQVATIMRALVSTGHPRGHLLLGVDDLGEPPVARDPAVAAEVHDRIARLPADQRARALRDEIRARTPACLALDELLGIAQGAPAHRRCRLMAKHVAEGLVRCGCEDADMLLTLMQPGLDDAQLPRASTATTFDSSALARPGATWGQIVEGLGQDELVALWVDVE